MELRDHDNEKEGNRNTVMRKPEVFTFEKMALRCLLTIIIDWHAKTRRHIPTTAARSSIIRRYFHGNG